MSAINLEPYITHLSVFRVVVCNFCEVCVPPKDPYDHYKLNHTATKKHPIPMNVRHDIAAYMKMLDLCEPKDVVHPENKVSQLKVIKKGYVCSFPGCGTCGTSEKSMHTHYYAHQASIPNGFRNWEETSLQTFFDGQHKK
jgi:hypothetical protein